MGEKVVAIFTLSERLRRDARPTIQTLAEAGRHVEVLTGDTKDRAEQLHQELGVAVRGELFPEVKVSAISQLRSEGRVVAMIGDGLNDAPAVATADVGIAMGRGADITRFSADICLLGDDLARIPWLLELARKTTRIVRQNLFWAFAYNGAAVVVALFGFVHPLVAGIAMVASSIFVVGNSLRLCSESSPAAVHTSAVEPISSFDEARMLCSTR